METVEIDHGEPSSSAAAGSHLHFCSLRRDSQVPPESRSCLFDLSRTRSLRDGVAVASDAFVSLCSVVEDSLSSVGGPAFEGSRDFGGRSAPFGGYLGSDSAVSSARSHVPLAGEG